MTFDEALDQVIEYLADDEWLNYQGCTRSERRTHIWQAVKVLMEHRGFACRRNLPPPKAA